MSAYRRVNSVYDAGDSPAVSHVNTVGMFSGVARSRSKKTYSKGEWTRVENVVRSQSVTRGHQWKLFPGRCRVNIRKHFFFCEHVIAPWNSLNIVSDDQRSIDTFRRLDVRSDLSSFVYY